jgi:DNA transposition AAA+ family ATPase
MASSTLKKLEQGYDNETEEHVIRLEYRMKIGDALPSKRASRMFEQKQAQRIKHLTELAARMNKNVAHEPSS